MQKRSLVRLEGHWFLGLSLLGLGFIPLILFSGRTSPSMSAQQSQLVWLAFTAICIAGTIAGVRPSGCSRSSKTNATGHDRTEGSGETMNGTRVVLREGHHYSCGAYSGHVVSVRKRVYCAGCTGLVIGGLTAGAGSLLHLVIGPPLGIGIVSFWFGFVGVAIGLLQHPVYRALKVQDGFARIVVNIAFVDGAFLILLGADQLAGSFPLDVYIIMMVLLWISTRVTTSRSEHSRICSECPEPSCNGRK